MYTFNDWLKMENVGRKAISAARGFATGDEAKMLGYLEHALGELRHAAGQLGESSDRLGHEPSNRATRAVVKEDDEAALQRLKEALFKRER